MTITEDRLKNKHGQSGADGNHYLRIKRVEIRVCIHEYSLLEKNAIDSGYRNVAQYLREAGLERKDLTSPFAKKSEKNKWLYEINRIGNNINQIAKKLNQGNSLDDDALLLLSQIQDIANSTLQIVLKDIDSHKVLK